MELRKRKNMRLKNYDYSKNGAYFITICVKDKHNLLWENDRLPLSDIGEIIDAEIHKIDSIYDNVYIDKYVIMPNHIHMIIVINTDETYGKQPGRPKVAPTNFLTEPPTISRIIKQFKGSISKQIGFSVWQKLFYDHVIRNEDEYQKIWQYIDMNPYKWQEDCYYEKNNK